MKKLILLFLSIIPLVFLGCAEEKNCIKFKTGEFKYTNKKMPEKIVRNDSMQIEINPIDGVEVYTSVNWISECKYTLTYKKILNHPNDVSYMIGSKILVDVVNVNGNKYTAYVKSGNFRKLIEFEKTN